MNPSAHKIVRPLAAILAGFAVLALVAADTPKPKKIDMARLLELHNKERAAAKLPPLKFNAKLEAAAKAHAKDMADHDKMTHDGSDGSTPAERVERQKYHFQTTGENVAQGQKSDEKVMEAWMDSPHHKDNILKPEFTEMGAACYVTDDGMPFWVVDFGTPWPEIDPAKAVPALLDAINAARAEEKRPALKTHPRLESAASHHAKAMADAGEFLKKDPDGQAPTERAQREGYPARAIAQNDAIGQTDPQKAVASWLKTDTSRDVLLGKEYSDIGIGLAVDKKGIPYWSVLFGKPRSARGR
ncbi:MAG: uncharacterized protein JWN86_4666 [Planctomycetota bacterium]|nr:uncharacterized protein [Planctomycetota bacterium]